VSIRNHLPRESLFVLLRDTFRDWKADRANLMAAALTFYTLLSLAPLLIVALSIAASLYGTEEAAAKLQEGLEVSLGTDSAGFVADVLGRLRVDPTRWLATIVGLVIVLWSAMRLFGVLQKAINIIWECNDTETIKDRLLAFLRGQGLALLMMVGLFLLWQIVLFASTAVGVVVEWADATLPDGLQISWLVKNGLSLLILATCFATINKFVPRTRVRWGDVWRGSLFTAALVLLGQKLMTSYLAGTAITSLFGAAGSTVVVLLWFYYLWMLVLFGASFTKVSAEHRRRRKPLRSKVQPSDLAAGRS